MNPAAVMTRPKTNTSSIGCNSVCSKVKMMLRLATCASRASMARKVFTSVSQAPAGVVQEQVLEGRLGDADVVQVDSGQGGERSNLGNQSAALVGVDVDRAASRLAHIGDAGHSLELLQQVGTGFGDVEADDVTARDR